MCVYAGKIWELASDSQTYFSWYSMEAFFTLLKNSTWICPRIRPFYKAQQKGDFMQQTYRGLFSFFVFSCNVFVCCYIEWSCKRKLRTNKWRKGTVWYSFFCLVWRRKLLSSFLFTNSTFFHIRKDFVCLRGFLFSQSLSLFGNKLFYIRQSVLCLKTILHSNKSIDRKNVPYLKNVPCLKIVPFLKKSSFVPLFL